jgi:hypothetical protein
VFKGVNMIDLDDTQKELLNALARKWRANPTMRFGQLLFNYTRFGTRTNLGSIRDCFFYEDKDILEDLKSE